MVKPIVPRSWVLFDSSWCGYLYDRMRQPSGFSSSRE